MSYRDVRAVNGYGPRCGCGGPSRLHYTTTGRPVTPQTSVFLCERCAELAIDAFIEHRGQQFYWPGDEKRDEPYVDPRGAA